MVDISMCSAEKCKRKNTCYRYLATPDTYRQSYIVVADVDDCQMYWECPSRSMRKRLDIQNEF